MSDNALPENGETPGDSFCFAPFKALRITSSGDAQPCCAFSGPLMKDGSPMSVGRNSVDEIWNSEPMRDVRRAMVEGKPVAGCELCYFHERGGLTSMRQQIAKGWEAAGESAEQVKSTAAENGYRVTARPVYLDLSLGNLCNLKCRMCNGSFSSAIADDRVQSPWVVPSWMSPEIEGKTPRAGREWFRRKELLYADLLREPGRLKTLVLIGGEPMLIKEAREIMRFLIDAGAAGNIALATTSNGTVVDDQWFELAAQFKHVLLGLSIDGFGAVNEYIRYPSRWSTVDASVRRWQKLSNAYLCAYATVSAYNMLDIVDLIRYCDDRRIALHCSALHKPDFLCSLAMPPAVRRKAAQKLRSYAAGAPRPDQGRLLDGLLAYAFGWRRPDTEALTRLASFWEAGANQLDADLLRQFMVYTNDLDATRGQSLAETLPELRDMLAEAGFAWTPELRFAR